MVLWRASFKITAALSVGVLYPARNDLRGRKIKLPMDKKAKENLNRLVEKAEMGFTRSMLRWKYNKEGRHIPQGHQLERESRQIIDRTHQVLTKRGKNVWGEFKKIYGRKNEKKEDLDE